MGDDLVNDAVTTLINARLSGADSDDQFAAAYFAGTLAEQGNDQTRTLLEPVVPYLIRALALEDARNLEAGVPLDDAGCHGSGVTYESFASRPPRCTLGRALHYITGETLDLRADVWWDWWQGQPPAFNTVGSLGQARTGHTATLLADGRALVVGGKGADGAPIALAELWDPPTGTFSPAGSLAEARSDHTATLLPDGRVIVSGGLSKKDDEGRARALGSAELWDPASGEFSAAGSLVWARKDHTATLLPDGRVLLAGGNGRRLASSLAGSDSHDRELSSAELWDPVSETFSSAEWLEEDRSEHTATLLADGRVLIVGGDGAEDGAELWDPASATFTAAGSLIEERRSHTATLLPDGRVLIVGGSAARGSAEVWDPASTTSSPAGSLTEGRYDHTATLLPDGRVLIMGGRDPISLAELWDPASGTFSPAGSLVEGRYDHTATLLPDGRVLVVGGHARYETLSSAELRDP